MEEKEIRYLARLARIRLTEGEVEGLKSDLTQLLEYVDQLKGLPTGAVEPTSTIVPAFNRFRADRARPSFPREAVLANAPERQADFFRVARVIKAEE
ncbi:MAG TPA: Asp-tRNA(Asn)/Glu-tRNA(Gln) amidotransferase subunit GatC [bacterium]|uniref:Aspartyl/glutamyl-tRNA(Asn/Gln) amidotransferase subunit C n=1 Tax=candidate division TA06 bacterium ADurb.Bin417 TaxID=1852828 RepID=A0A1V5MBD4_UNCT6|nr:MAG: Glutamyl-tRNA(Gln) amidotransferase subunit C [candidate division TA06 bacterium ADurb.Bin417]HNQ35284.1 Asp-tRNA(Asn)/Glu-tRNA(Gln) amidotransferase subunit GatC [bacterium]HNS48212.1 Asp-tRNA(Asn)/Glu-tRNA(Gln) amidotransferase subunit GatC [bacterium]